MHSTIYLLPFVPFLLTVHSAPTPQYQSAYGAPGGGGIPCNEVDGVKDVSNSDIFADPAGWKQAPIPPVTSSTKGSASLSEVHSVSYGITITEGVSLGLNLPQEVGTLGFDSSVAWSKTTTDGYSDTVTCPEGNYVCGANTLAKFVTIKGTAIKVQGKSASCDKPGEEVGDSPQNPFSFDAPAMLGNASNVQFGPCICKSSPNQTTTEGLGLCPEDC